MQSSDTCNNSMLANGSLKKQKRADAFEILITTDNHMGYREKDAVVGADSFHAFEECLQIANQRNVDFVLLGGDLFHDQRPS